MKMKIFEVLTEMQNFLQNLKQQMFHLCFYCIKSTRRENRNIQIEGYRVADVRDIILSYIILRNISIHFTSHVARGKENFEFLRKKATIKANSFYCVRFLFIYMNFDHI